MEYETEFDYEYGDPDWWDELYDEEYDDDDR
jgi:hypothetical protein